MIGAGKASAAMARAVEDHWPGEVSGLVITPYGHGVACRSIEMTEAAHPIPDSNGAAATMKLLERLKGLTADDLVLCLISGGGSALLSHPLPGLTLGDEQALNTALLASGATISEINCVRRHFSGIKGGRLAAACFPARVLNLIISDVPGDNPIDIASGPTVPDPTTCRDALSVLRRYKIAVSQRAVQLLENGEAESLKSGDPRLPPIETRVIATPYAALQAAADVARAAGLTPYILGDALEGEARDVGKVLAAIALNVAYHGEPFQMPCVLLSGGETTVTVKGAGRGGRNVEFLLALALALDGHAGITALAADTDGVDGMEDIAGAVISPDTLTRSRARGLEPRAHLDNNDGHGFFEALGDSVVTGATLTNVNDFRAIIISDETRHAVSVNS